MTFEQVEDALTLALSRWERGRAATGAEQAGRNGILRCAQNDRERGVVDDGESRVPRCAGVSG
jgi:hypothetical protein